MQPFVRDAVRHGVIQHAREVHRRAVRQMAAVRQIHAEERVARLEEGGHRGEVRLRAGVRLHVRVLGAEELLRAIDRQLLHLVDDLAAAVVALARQSLGVLVRERRPHRLEHGRRDEVLARDQLEPFALPLRSRLR